MTRFALACHEAGHAVAALLLGRTVTGVSIILDGAGFKGGVVGHQAVEQPEPIPPSTSLSTIFLYPWDARREFEQQLVICLAGAVAERIYGDDLPPGYVALDGDELWAREAVARRIRLPERARRLFDGAEASAPENDLQTQLRLGGYASSGRPYADRFIAWVEAEVGGWARCDSFRLPLARVVRALLEHGELSGDEVEALVRGKEAAGMDIERLEAANAT